MEVAYARIPFSTIKYELKEESIHHWEREWSNTINGNLTKSYFPSVQSRLQKKLVLNHNLTAFVTGHGKFAEYFVRFKIKTDPNCVCKQKSVQTVDHILWECELLESERDDFQKSVRKPGGQWPIDESELMNSHLKDFQKFINKINFEVFLTM